MYKARWQGAIVAIKVVEHAAETERNLALRESTLATSIQHPNVVRLLATYLCSGALHMAKVTVRPGS